MTVQTDTQRPQRAYASGIQATFLGLMTFPVDAMPIKATDKSTEFKVICPDCTKGDPVQLSQQYACPANGKHGPYTGADAARAKVIDKVLYRVTQEEIDAIKRGDNTDASFPSDSVSFDVFNATEVERHTRPSGTGYRLKPKGAFPLYSMLVDLVSDRSLAFIAELTLRGTQKLFRAEAWNGQIVLTELARPGELAPTDEFPSEYDGKLLAKATELCQLQVADFDPEQYRNLTRERALQFDAEKLAEGDSPKPKAKAKPKPKPTESDSMLAMLEAAVAGAKSQ